MSSSWLHEGHFFVPVVLKWNVFFHQIMCLESYTLFCRLFLSFMLGNCPFHWAFLCYLRTREISPSSVTEWMTRDSSFISHRGWFLWSVQFMPQRLWANESGGWGWVRQWTDISHVFPSHLNSRAPEWRIYVSAIVFWIIVILVAVVTISPTILV